MRHSHLIVLHDDPDGRHGRSICGSAGLAACLRRMAIGRVTAVTRIEEVKRLEHVAADGDSPTTLLLTVVAIGLALAAVFAVVLGVTLLAVGLAT